MKRPLAILLFLILLAIALWILFGTGANGQTLQQEPTARVFSSRVGGDWLKVERFNLKDDPAGFHPCYTEVRCAYKPIVTRNADGTYLIQFVSEIAQGLP